MNIEKPHNALDVAFFGCDKFRLDWTGMADMCFILRSLD